MNKIKSLNVQVYNWLFKINPCLWVRSYFSTRTKSDVIVNNLNEPFNWMIRKARDMPNVSYLDWIRRKIDEENYK